jgi:hypothetical protein
MDLLIWILGGNVPQKVYVHKFRDNEKLTPGFVSQFETDRGAPVYISSVYNSPVNSTMRFYTDDEYMFELKPLERLVVYKGFEVSDPTSHQPIRLYNPKVISEDFETGDGFKPGFLTQAEAFISHTCQSDNSTYPNLETSFDVTSMIEELLN